MRLANGKALHIDPAACNCDPKEDAAYVAYRENVNKIKEAAGVQQQPIIDAANAEIDALHNKHLGDAIVIETLPVEQVPPVAANDAAPSQH